MSELIGKLENVLRPDQLETGDKLNERYNHIWEMDKALKAKVLVEPESTQEVSQIMSVCNQLEQKVVVFGGLTNLVGGTETEGDELIISLERMNKIEELDSSSRTMTVQAGVCLQEVQERAGEADLLFPLNFGAKGSAQMGGIVSSNAGGLRVFRFGMTRQLVLGLEVVLPDGTIIDSLKKIIKDNSAYDLKQLFIGSEGTLGVVTRMVLKLTEKPESRCAAYVGLHQYDRVVELLKFMDRKSAGKLSGFELIWKDTYKAMTSPPASSRPPLPQDYKYYVLIELMGGDQNADMDLLESLLSTALESGLIEDAVLAYTASDMEWFWKIREDVHVFVSLCDFDQHFDVSLPVGEIGDYVDGVIEKMKDWPEITHIFPFGHVADGNVHFVIGKTQDGEDLKSKVNELIYRPLKAYRGSVSAEHGIGKHKKDYLSISRSHQEIELMKLIKRTLDPKAILGPGKIFAIEN
jgi:FAD/FMN-containing dehydrogenase